MGRIDEEKIREIRERTDIVEVVGRYLPLKRSGANHLGLCPFHQEKTPSFNVNASRQIFHCFGCGVGGNVFSFLMRMDGLSFPDAVRRLGEQVGIEVVEEAVTPAEQQRRAERQRLFEVYQVAAAFYHQKLLAEPTGAPGRRYLRRRGYEGESVREFELGFAPEGWEALATYLVGQGFPQDALRNSGLVRPGKQDRGDYDLFRNRLLFPIRDLQGRTVAFGGRVLDDSLPKYINSPESAIYQKSQVLYGLDQAKDAMRRNGETLVTEGYFDVLALHRAGFTGSVATCGTALTAEHGRLIKRFAEKVLLVFDQDAAGRQATFRAMDVLLPAGLSVLVVELPAGADPDSLLADAGAGSFRERLDSARPVLEVFLADQLRSQDESVEGRARAAEQVLARLRKLPSELERNLYVKRLAEASGIDESLLQAKVRGGSADRSARITARSEPVARQPVRRQTTEGAERSQASLLHLMLIDDSKFRAKVSQEGTESLFPHPDYRAVADYLLACEDDQGRLPDDLNGGNLSEDQQAILAGLLFRQDHGWAENAERIFADCLEKLRHPALKRRLQELLERLEEAERRGDDAEVEACLRERSEINRQLKK